MSKDDGSEAADAARRDEEARQARIRFGTSRINKIFDGGTLTPVKATGAAFDPSSGQYFNADGTPFTTKLKNFDNEAIFTKGAPTTGFDDAFYKGRRDAYTNYATPQLDQQNADASKQLTFSLDRGGLLDSSVRGQKLSDLQRLYDTQKQAVADKALSYETGARNSVEDARANLISTLNATGDAEGAATSALARSKALTAPPAYDPLGQLFTDFTNGLGIQAAQERSYAAGGAKPAYNTGLFSNTGRVSVTG